MLQTGLVWDRWTGTGHCVWTRVHSQSLRELHATFFCSHHLISSSFLWIHSMLFLTVSRACSRGVSPAPESGVNAKKFSIYTTTSRVQQTFQVFHHDEEQKSWSSLAHLSHLWTAGPLKLSISHHLWTHLPQLKLRVVGGADLAQEPAQAPVVDGVSVDVCTVATLKQTSQPANLFNSNDQSVKSATRTCDFLGNLKVFAKLFI